MPSTQFATAKAVRAAFIAFGAGAVALSSPALAAPWELETVIDIGAIYTDNLRLEEQGLEESELLYRVAPLFTLSTEGDRLDADIRYRPEAIFFSEAAESDEVFHTLDADMTASVIRDAVFFYARATHSQSIVTPEARIPTSNIPITLNRTDSTVLEARPYWQQDLGFADVMLEYAFVDTQYENPELLPGSLIQDNTENRGRFNLNNYSNARGLAWALEYEDRRLDYDFALPWEYRQAFVSLGFWLDGVARLFVTGGAETPFDAITDPSMDDEFWEAGFQYRPSQRLNLEIAAGERGYGESYRAQMTYESRRGETTFVYSDRPATRGEVGFERRPLSSTDNLDGFLDRPGRSDRFIQKRAELATRHELSKTDISLRIFSEERYERTTDTGIPLDDEKFAGIAFRLQWNIGTRSAIGLAADLTERDTTVSEDKLQRYAFDFSYRMSQRLSLILLAQRSDQTNESAGIPGYTENQYGLTLRVEL